ncbi:MAG: Outer membrane protein [uncultured Campylobacterales bacterium]|uniref:Outer membrane protein n=1 Tax=uncultured Campylobacterales bacterium TaxID=352960 RepID=A0A6S6S9S1_9BACT|nr:MAG: Outer membrane protein [uncultured Campylobacterales bacterium]
MKKMLVIVGLLSSFLFADFIGFGIGGGVHFNSLDGTASHKSDSVSFNSEDNADNYFWAYAEHPVPLLPNVKLRYQKTSESDFELTQLDSTLYYEILSNIVSLDVGLNFKLADLTIGSGDGALILPMAYIGAKFSPPFIDAQIVADLSVLSYSDTEVRDLSIALHYDLSGFLGFDLGLEVGYKSQTVEVDDISNIEADLELSGMFTSVYFNF